MPVCSNKSCRIKFKKSNKNNSHYCPKCHAAYQSGWRKRQPKLKWLRISLAPIKITLGSHLLGNHKDWSHPVYCAKFGLEWHEAATGARLSPQPSHFISLPELK